MAFLLIADRQCTKCPEGQWSESRSTNCTPPIFDSLTWDTSEALEITLAVVLVVLLNGSVGVVLLKHRGTFLVKAAGGALGYVALLSLIGSCLSLLLFLGKPGDLVCRLQLPIIAIFQTVALSIITAISIQVRINGSSASIYFRVPLFPCYTPSLFIQIFFLSEFPVLASSYLNLVRGPGSWLLLLICCVVQAGICGWFAQAGPSLTEYMANMKIDFVRSFLACPVDPLAGLALMQGSVTALALVSFMCTFMAAKPPHQYNLARDITFSSLIYCVIWVTFIPIYISLTEKFKCIVYVSFTLISNFGLVAAYYFPKCYLLLKKPELNAPEYFSNFLEGVPTTPVEEEQQTETETESKQ